MPGVIGVKRQEIKREPVSNSKVYCRVTLECGHILSHIQIAKSDRARYRYCQQCLEEQKG